MPVPDLWSYCYFATLALDRILTNALDPDVQAPVSTAISYTGMLAIPLVLAGIILSPGLSGHLAGLNLYGTTIPLWLVLYVAWFFLYCIDREYSRPAFSNDESPAPLSQWTSKLMPLGVLLSALLPATRSRTLFMTQTLWCFVLIAFETWRAFRRLRLESSWGSPIRKILFWQMLAVAAVLPAIGVACGKIASNLGYAGDRAFTPIAGLQAVIGAQTAMPTLAWNTSVYVTFLGAYAFNGLVRMFETLTARSSSGAIKIGWPGNDVLRLASYGVGIFLALGYPAEPNLPLLLALLAVLFAHLLIDAWVNRWHYRNLRRRSGDEAIYWLRGFRRLLWLLPALWGGIKRLPIRAFG